MNGAESLVKTLLASGVDTVFANPGTSEMHFVAALDRIPGMRCILGLFEGVVTGAADGYGRMAGRPAATLLHCGPGLANGLANLHNARRARSPVVNIVGDQATHHRPFDAPLTADTEGWARGASAWVRTAHSAETVGQDAAQAVQAARIAPGQVATLILPSDTSWNEGGVVAPALPIPQSAPPDAGALEQSARALRSGEPCLLLLGGGALRAEPLAIAAGLCAATGARMLAETFNTRVERGAGRIPIERVPYVIGPALDALAGFKHIILVGAVPPVAFFAYPGRPNRLYPPACTLHVLARPETDGPAALAMLADALGTQSATAPALPRPQSATGAVTPGGMAQTLAALLPEAAIVVDESITYGFGAFAPTHAAAPHDWLQLMGGAIGSGPPLATGAAVAAPGRRVVNLQADGSALYTVQALWTQARERLDVTTVILANRAYAVLRMELAAVGANPGRTALDMLDLGNPDLNWCQIAAGLGVESARAETLAQFATLLSAANRRTGPFLIELCC